MLPKNSQKYCRLHRCRECSRDKVQKRATEQPKRIFLIEHQQNQGVGGSIATGYKWCRDKEIDVAVIMAGDAQMDPSDLPALLDPVVKDEVDYAKGNRLFTGDAWKIIPRVRYLGNSAMSLLTKIASGYWHVADSQCGYTAINLAALKRIEWDEMYKRYGQPNDLLVRPITFAYLKCHNCQIHSKFMETLMDLMDARLKRMWAKLEEVYLEEGFSSHYWLIFNYINKLNQNAGIPELRRQPTWPPVVNLPDRWTSPRQVYPKKPFGINLVRELDEDSTDKLDVFIAYSQTEANDTLRKEVEAIAEELKRRGVSIYSDQMHDQPSSLSSEYIERVILSSVKAVAVFIGENRLTPWQDRGIRKLISLAVQREMTVISVLLPSLVKEPAFPSFMRGLTKVELAQTDDIKALDYLEWCITGKHQLKVREGNLMYQGKTVAVVVPAYNEEV